MSNKQRPSCFEPEPSDSISYEEPIPTIGDVLEAIEPVEQSVEEELWQADPCTHTDNPNRCREIGRRAFDAEELRKHLEALAF